MLVIFRDMTQSEPLRDFAAGGRMLRDRNWVGKARLRADMALSGDHHLLGVGLQSPHTQAGSNMRRFVLL
jgi:hypothetical protein